MTKTLIGTAVQIAVPPSAKVTVPPSGAGLVAAVQITWLPVISGFAVEAAAVVAAILLPVWVSEPVLAVKFPSPP